MTRPLTWQLILTGETATGLAGERLGQLAMSGLLIALVGPLGAGKTTFVRGLAIGLEIADPRVVSSPTFLLIQEYEARLPIYHLDVYRLRDVESFWDLGVAEYWAGDGVCVIEWADRVLDLLPPERLLVQLAHHSPTSRLLTVTGPDTASLTIAAEWQDRLLADGIGTTFESQTRAADSPAIHIKSTE